MVERASLGSEVGEADLVVDDDVHRAAGEEAARLRQLQRLHDDALAGEMPRRHAPAAAARARARTSPRRSWRARTEPSTTGLTTSRCEGLKASTVWTLPLGVRRSAEKPLWYFTSPEPLQAARCRRLAFEFGEQRGRATCRAGSPAR